MNNEKFKTNTITNTNTNKKGGDIKCQDLMELDHGEWDQEQDGA